MKKPPKKSTCSSKPRRISHLPADVICIILTFLPVKEAARTSILSRDWRHLWKSIPQLVFDSNFATVDPNPDSDSESELDKVMLNVNQVLRVHDGAINKFELSIPGMHDWPQLDQLIHYLSTKSVDELSLSFTPCSTYVSLPASLFALPNLSSPTLDWFIFGTSNLSMGFSKLTFLEFNHVELPPQFFEKFLPNCPLLQELRVLECEVTDKHPVFATSSVKVLHFQPWKPCTIRFMHTPHLSVLTILQSCYNDDHFYYHVNNVDGEVKGDMVALFGSLPALEQLHLGIHMLFFLSEVDNVPYQLPALLLHNLKVLEIPCLSLGRLKQSGVLVCLIRSSPNLRKLTIGNNNCDADWSSENTLGLQKLLKPEDNCDICCLQQLEEFNILYSLGNRLEFELVRFVLANSPVLKRVFIKSGEDFFHFYYYSRNMFGKLGVLDMLALFCSVPSLEHLNLGLHWLLMLSNANDVPYQLPGLLHNLKVIEIPHVLLSRLTESALLACLIRSSPNLRKLSIGHDNDDPRRKPNDTVSLQKLLEPEDKRGVCCLQHLEEFNIQNSRGNRVELELVRFVLANSPILKRVFIKPNKDLCPDTMLKFVVEEVTKYKRISKDAEVKFELMNVDEA